MSTNRISLKHPAVVGVVALGLVGVVALNISTFAMPQRGARSAERGVRVQAHPPVPMDARPAVWNINRTQEEPKAGKRMEEPLKRDPFFPMAEQSVPTVPKKVRKNKRRKGPARKPAAKPMVCTAVLLMGKSPMAVIDGVGRSPGETVRGLTVKEIDADGVTLMDANGGVKHLSIGPEKQMDQAYRVVTRVEGAHENGQTRLNDQ